MQPLLRRMLRQGSGRWSCQFRNLACIGEQHIISSHACVMQVVC